MKAISVHVAEDHYQAFKSLAKLWGRPVAELVREAMAEYLAGKRKRGRSVLEIPAHSSGRQLEDWSRSDLLDDMIGHPTHDDRS